MLTSVSQQIDNSNESMPYLGSTIAGGVWFHTLETAPLKHPQQHKYNNDDYYHNYDPNYALHRFVPFSMRLIILLVSPEGVAKARTTRHTVLTRNI